MFQFGRYRLFNLCIQLKIISHYADWVAPFGDLRVNAFFQLTEAFRRFRVLHRLLMPRHPPIALNSLTKNILVSSIKYWATTCIRFNPYALYLLLYVKIILKRWFLSVNCYEAFSLCLFEDFRNLLNEIITSLPQPYVMTYCLRNGYDKLIQNLPDLLWKFTASKPL